MNSFLDQAFTQNPSLSNTGILIVDEDPAFFMGLKTFLKEYTGFEQVFVARNGKDAIELVESEPSIELLTVDYQMPEMDGLELMDQLQESSPRPLGVTMITGFPSDELRQEFTQKSSSKLQANQLLAKPLEFEKLETVIVDSFEKLRGTSVESLEPTANGALTDRIAELERALSQNTQTLRKIEKTTARNALLTVLFRTLMIALVCGYVWQQGWIEKGWNKFRSQPSADTPSLFE